MTRRARFAAMRKRWPAVILALAVAVAAAVLARPARAHPAGFTSINRYLGVSCEDDALRIAYVLDFAEMASYTEIESLDGDHDGTVSPDEQRMYLAWRLPPLVARWELEVDGVRVEPHIVASRLEIREGEQGLPTIRIDAEVRADAGRATDAREVRVRVVDRAFWDRSGWRELAADDSTTWAATAGPKEDPSNALDYAGGRRVPRLDESTFVFHRSKETFPEGNGARPDPSPPRFGSTVAVDPRLVRLSQALRTASGSGAFTAMALAIAVALGAIHALSPGHGKALAAAYLAGTRARASQAVIFGTIVTAAHTAVVFAVGFLAVAIERTVGSDRVMRDLELAAAAIVVVLGAMQLAESWRNLIGAAALHEHGPSRVGLAGGRSVFALGASAGLTPCPSALAVLLTAIAVHRYGFGLLLVVAFSAGVAGTLTVTGLLVVLARRLLDRLVPGGAFLRWLPMLSSLGMVVIGVVLCASAW